MMVSCLGEVTMFNIHDLLFYSALIGWQDFVQIYADILSLTFDAVESTFCMTLTML